MLELGVKVTGTKRTPEIFLAFRYWASSFPLIHGAPMISNGVSVPRPTEIFVNSTSAIPGYNVVCVRSRRFGEGFTQASPVESNQSPRNHPCMWTTVNLA